jgi:hypothetical protein
MKKHCQMVRKTSEGKWEEIKKQTSKWTQSLVHGNQKRPKSSGDQRRGAEKREWNKEWQLHQAKKNVFRFFFSFFV